MGNALAEKSSPPAGGAAFDQILIAAAIVAVLYLPLAWFLLRERAGRSTWIGRLADRAAAVTDLPRWTALPVLLGVVSLVTAAFGVYWDVPIHMQVGRDEGPLANPSHFPILFGILGFLAAGVISAALARDPLPRRTARFSAGWHVPMGSMVLLGAGLIAAAGFPADDVWHRLFGQDVTEWGPTHVMMIGGAVTASLAVPLLIAESAQVGAPRGPRAVRLLGGISTRLLLTIAVAFCVIPMAFLMEFDLGVPQFPAATLFIISGFLTGWIFTTCRLLFGPGGALVGWVTYQVIRVLILLVTLPIPDIHRARWLLFLGAAVAIELLALVVRSRGPLFAGLAGLLAGTVGMAVEWWWMGVFMPYPLPPESGQMPLMLAVGGVAGVGGGLLGWSWQRHLVRIAGTGLPAPAAPVSDERPAAGRWVGTVGVLMFVALMAVFAPPRGAGEVDVVKECEPEGCVTSYVPVEGTDVVTGRTTYDDACVGSDGCRATVTVTLEPTDSADDAVWISAIAYQGKRENDDAVPGDGMITTAMEPTGEPGEFRSADPLPLYGEWKVLVRLHLAPTTMVALPLHMPEDAAIDGDGAGLVQAADGDTVPFVHEPMLLQRERKDGVPVWLWTVAYGLVIAAWLGLLAFYGWCYSAAARGPAGRAVSADGRGNTRHPATQRRNPPDTRLP